MLFAVSSITFIFSHPFIPPPLLFCHPLFCYSPGSRVGRVATGVVSRRFYHVHQCESDCGALGSFILFYECGCGWLRQILCFCSHCSSFCSFFQSQTITDLDEHAKLLVRRCFTKLRERRRLEKMDSLLGNSAYWLQCPSRTILVQSQWSAYHFLIIK